MVEKNLHVVHSIALLNTYLDNIILIITLTALQITETFKKKKKLSTVLTLCGAFPTMTGIRQSLCFSTFPSASVPQVSAQASTPPSPHPSYSPPPSTKDYTHHHTHLRQSPFWCGCFRGQPSAAFWPPLFLYIRARLLVEPCAGISMDSNSMMTVTLCVLHSLYLTVS